MVGSAELVSLRPGCACRRGRETEVWQEPWELQKAQLQRRKPERGGRGGGGEEEEGRLVLSCGVSDAKL